MTEEDRDNGLEDLFREKLGENELVVGSDLTGRFMGRLGRREFFRFTPSRFNIWYLTAGLAALTVAGVMLLSGNAGEKGAAMPGPEYSSAAPAMISATDSDSLKVTGADEPRSVMTDTSNIPYDTAEQDVVLDTALQVIATPAPGETLSRESAIATGNQASGSVKEGRITASTAGQLSQTDVRQPLSALSLKASAGEGCAPLRVSFICNAPEGNKISWSFGDGGTSSLHNPDYIYDIPGRYRVILTTIDSHGGISAATARIDVWERPRASFEVRDADPAGEGERVNFINMSSGAVNYLWDFGDGTFSTLSDPSYRYGSTGEREVKLVAYSTEGCADSVSVSDLFTGQGMHIRFPNAFIPNPGGPTGGYYNQRTDEESQVFHPVYAGISEYNLKIYNRAGLLVFESNDPAMGWDGWHKGGLCAPGVYVWKARGSYRNGNTFITAGDVTLLKY